MEMRKDLLDEIRKLKQEKEVNATSIENLRKDRANTEEELSKVMQQVNACNELLAQLQADMTVEQRTLDHLKSQNEALQEDIARRQAKVKDTTNSIRREEVTIANNIANYKESLDQLVENRKTQIEEMLNYLAVSSSASSAASPSRCDAERDACLHEMRQVGSRLEKALFEKSSCSSLELNN